MHADVEELHASGMVTFDRAGEHAGNPSEAQGKTYFHRIA